MSWQGVDLETGRHGEAEGVLGALGGAQWSRTHATASAFEAIAAPVAVLSGEGRVVRCNRACRALAGRSSADVEGRFFWELGATAEGAERLRRAVAELRMGREAGEHETLWRTSRGPRWLSWSMTRLRDAATGCIVATGVDITDRRHLQQELLEAGEQQQRRIGRDLHDALGQHLTGVAFLGKALEARLAAERHPQSAHAGKIVDLINTAVAMTRDLARGLLFPMPAAGDLATALRQLAGDLEDVFDVSCRVTCSGPVPVVDEATGGHVCQIAREAVTNAVKHGRARQIVVELGSRSNFGVLTVRDDGVGFPRADGEPSGLGLGIMRCRAALIGGTLAIARGGQADTQVTLEFPAERRKAEV